MLRASLRKSAVPMLMLFFPMHKGREAEAPCSFRNPFTPYCRLLIRAKMYPSSFFLRLPIGSHHGIALRSDSIAFDTSTGLQAGGAAGKNAGTSDDTTLEKLRRASGWGKVPPHAIRGRVRAQRRVPDRTPGRTAQGRRSSLSGRTRTKPPASLTVGPKRRR